MANNINFGGGNGGGGSSTLSGLSDVTLSSPTNGQVLKYDGSKWVNGAGGGSSGHTYSTTEQVVGTWVDGKPLYEKTIVYSGNIAHNSYKTIDNSLSYSGVDFFTVLNTSVKLATVDTWFTYSFGGLYYDLALSDALGVYVENFSHIYNISDVVVTICYTKLST